MCFVYSKKDTGVTCFKKRSLLRIKTLIDDYLAEQKFVTLKCVNTSNQCSDHISVSFNCINMTKQVGCKGIRSFHVKHDGKGFLNLFKNKMTLEF